MSSQNITGHLARFIYNLSPRDIPNEVLDIAKNHILDALATAIAGHGSPYPSIALGVVRGNKGKAAVFSYGLRVPAMDAAFVNAVLVNSIGQDDMLFFAHPGSVIVPVSIAVSEEEDRSGPEVIVAIVAGYEVLGRLFLAAPNIVPRFASASIFGTFGAAATTGKLLKLDEDRLANALGYAAHLSSGLTECWRVGTMEGRFQVGFASRSGIMAATLAKEGAIAAETTLEGEAGFYQAFAGTTSLAEEATAELGKRFLIMESTSKSYPICGLQQIPVDLALTLAKQHNINGRDIAKVVETVSESDFLYPGTNNAGPFTTRVQAIMSAQFCAAAAFLGKPVSSHSFYDNGYRDPEVAKLAKKIELRGEKDRQGTRIEVVLRDGRQYSIEGGGSDMLVPTTERIRAKFRNLASESLGAKRAEEVINIVLNFEKVENVRQLTNMLG